MGQNLDSASGGWLVIIALLKLSQYLYVYVMKVLQSNNSLCKRQILYILISPVMGFMREMAKHKNAPEMGIFRWMMIWGRFAISDSVRLL